MMPWGTLGSKKTEETSLIIAFQKTQARSLALSHASTHTHNPLLSQILICALNRALLMNPE